MLTAVISDYNWLPPDEADWWFVPLCDKYLVFDKYHRFNSSPSVIRQKNVGQNIYDMLDFICTNIQFDGDCFAARVFFSLRPKTSAFCAIVLYLFASPNFFSSHILRLMIIILIPISRSIPLLPVTLIPLIALSLSHPLFLMSRVI